MVSSFEAFTDWWRLVSRVQVRFSTLGIQGFAVQCSRSLLLVSCITRAADFQYGKPQGRVRSLRIGTWPRK